MIAVILFSCFLYFTFASELFTLSHQCFNPGLQLLGTLSCSLAGDEQVFVTTAKSIARRNSTDRSTLDGQQNHQLPSPYHSNKTDDPWTHTPICTQSLDVINEPLCIYTNARFAYGRGISILTTPTKAKKLLQLPGFQDVNSLSSLNYDDRDRPWRVVSVPGRGMGLLATRPLDIGDKITAYTPVFVATHYVSNVVGTQDLEYLFRRAIDQLPQTSQEKFLDLAHQYDSNEYQVQDIVQTNCFEFDVDGEMHLAVFPETSRINHSCGANSQYHLNSTLPSHQVFAARPIAPGEEITISYSFPVIKYSIRSSNLQSTFHFNCQCSRCQNRHESDSRVAAIESIETSLSDWSPTSSVTRKRNGPRLAQELIQLYKEDDLHAILVRPYGLAAQEYSALKDAKRAKKYAELAVQYGLLKEGEGGGDVSAMREIVSDVKSHWTWGKRVSGYR